MQMPIKDVEDLRLLLGHTGGFRGGYVTDVRMSKRRLFDEGSGREVLADTVVTVVIRYSLRHMERVAKLTMRGVTDFSVFEQEGADCSGLSVIHAECTAGKLRFWFDPQGELYVVCDEAQLEEVSMPSCDDRTREPVARWTFQSPTAEWPTIEWLLGELDNAGMPCTWKKAKAPKEDASLIRWEGTLLPAHGADAIEQSAVHVMLYGPLDGPGFGILLHLNGSHGTAANRLLSCSVRPHRSPLFRSVPGRQYDHTRRRMAQLEVIGAAAVDEHGESGPVACQARASSFVAPAPSALGV